MNEDARISASIASVPPVFPPVLAPRLGIVMLDTCFPRPLGDVGHPDRWGVATERLVVPGAWPDKVVQSGAALRDAGVVPEFKDAVRALARQQGVRAITTSCGFLVLLQRELQSVSAVPVVTSSLLLLPGLLRNERKVGVLTISAARLGDEHLAAAGVAPEQLGNVVVQGVDPNGEFANAILGNRAAMDLERAAADVVAAAVVLRQRAPDLRTVVLECTNMPPSAGRISEATGLRVVTLMDSPVLRRALGLGPGPGRGL